MSMSDLWKLQNKSFEAFWQLYDKRKFVWVKCDTFSFWIGMEIYYSTDSSPVFALFGKCLEFIQIALQTLSSDEWQ